jgi:hypothetical protein
MDTTDLMRLCDEIWADERRPKVLGLIEAVRRLAAAKAPADVPGTHNVAEAPVPGKLDCPECAKRRASEAVKKKRAAKKGRKS